ncbi:carboxylesterase family protein [Salinisphaera aquimarina]
MDDGGETNALQRETAQGAVVGVEEDRQLSFKGVPYAAAPTGERRFALPQPAPRRSQRLAANAFGSPCPQGGGTFGIPSTDEDCLFLNIYTPKADGSYPVMVWIHGGAFVTGSGGANYNPLRLVDKDVVVVTINYRLGAFGFLAHPALTAASEDAGSGDYGLMDQQAALQWVQDNIANFGGDPDNVTVFGESAGGHSVLSQLASPAAAGLFDQAIVESGAYSPGQRTLAQAESQGQQIADALGCRADSDVADCLRDASVEDIVAAQAAFDFIPNTRPQFLPNSIAQAIGSGDFNRVPVLEGTNRDEGELFIAIDELTRDAAFGPDDYRPRIAAALGAPKASAAVDAVAQEYPLADYSDTSHALAAIFTDSTFACNGLAQVGALSVNVNTYAYAFADRGAPSLLPPAPSFPDYGAAHAYEISYVLNTEAAMRERGAGDDQIALSNAMIDYWTSFAKTGDPNPSAGDRPFWETFASNGNYQELVAPEPRRLSSSDFSARHHCDFWQSFGAQ